MGRSNVAVTEMFRQIISLFTATGEQKKFARLRKEIEAPFTVASARADVEAIFGGARTKDDALNEFVALLAARPEINEVLHRHGWVGVSGLGGSHKLKELYLKLIVGGAGQRIRGVYVATAAISDSKFLNLLLEWESTEAVSPHIGVIAMRYVANRAERRISN
jgi:hypothetical protein